MLPFFCWFLFKTFFLNSEKNGHCCISYEKHVFVKKNLKKFFFTIFVNHCLFCQNEKKKVYEYEFKYFFLTKKYKKTNFGSTKKSYKTTVIMQINLMKRWIRTIQRNRKPPEHTAFASTTAGQCPVKVGVKKRWIRTIQRLNDWTIQRLILVFTCPLSLTLFICVDVFVHVSIVINWITILNKTNNSCQFFLFFVCLFICLSSLL